MLCPGGSAASGSGGAQTLGLGRSGQLRRSARSASPEQLQAQGDAKQKRRHAEEVVFVRLCGSGPGARPPSVCVQLGGGEAAGWAALRSRQQLQRCLSVNLRREAQGQFRYRSLGLTTQTTKYGCIYVMCFQDDRLLVLV
jgi:hypothetical protein